MVREKASARCRAALAGSYFAIAVGAAHAQLFSVDWTKCNLQRNTAASVLVAVDPEWQRGGKMHDISVEGVRQLAIAGAGYLRLLDFNIFPGISNAQLQPGQWDFNFIDEALEDFMSAAASGNASVMVDIETSPDWMWRGANASTNHTCADATSTSLPVGPKNRCPFYGDPTTPIDGSWSQIADYFARVASRYTRGGFEDEHGTWRGGGKTYKIDRWEILNEVNHPREHDFNASDYIAFYDEQVRAFQHQLGGLPGDKVVGPSLGGLSPGSIESWVRPFLDPRSHSPPSTPVGGMTFHQYASCDDPTAEGLEPIFERTRDRMPVLAQVQQARDELRPSAELHLTESGILCNSPKWCDVNNYTCWYRNFDQTYWAASSAQWTYQFLLSAQAADLTSIAQSQIIGYPYRFNGLSGEWPCGSMVDWDSLGLNQKFWVELALLQSMSRPFSFCDSGVANEGAPPVPADPGAPVYVQGLESSKGRIVVAINTKKDPQQVQVQGAGGKRVLVVDAATGTGPAREETVPGSGTLALQAFGTAIIRMDG